MTLLGRLLVPAMLSALAMPAAAQTPPKPAPVRVDPVFEAARAAFEAWPEAERRMVQDALVWTGDYNGGVTGGFGRRTFEGIGAYRKRMQMTPGGGLDDSERAALLAAGEAARRAARFRVQVDPASGTTLGIPERALPKRSSLPGGTRWQSADGRVSLDTTSYPAGGTSLDALFERAGAATPDRKVTYTLKKPDFFVVTGETATGRFYIRYAAAAAGIRGFSLGYDKALANGTDRLAIAVANSFVPFPQAVEARAVPETAVPSAPPPKAPPSVGATGLAVSASHVLTSSAALDGCRSPRIGDRPARPGARDAEGGLLLLQFDRVPGGHASPAVRAEAPAPDEPLLAIAADGAGGAGVAPAVAGPGGVSAPLQPGAGGAPVLDRAGRLVGLVLRMPASPRLVAGVLPPARYALVPGRVISAFLASGRIETAAHDQGAAGGPAAAAAPVLGAVVAIRCDG